MIEYARQIPATRRKVKAMEAVVKETERKKSIRHMKESLRQIIDDPNYFDREYYIDSLQKAIERLREEGEKDR